MSKAVVILGSTGSIGVSALAVIEQLPGFRVFALTAKSRADLLIRQMKRHRPKFAVIGDETLYAKVKRNAPRGCRALAGATALEELAAHPEARIVVNALVGFAGLLPSVASLKSGKRLCLANKESLVAAGQILVDLLKRRKDAELIPIDSEHSALFQGMLAGQKKEVRRVILTASGGPFRTLSSEQLKRVTVEQALKHPNWNMGAKITIDSATLANKALEVIEARWLFDLPPEKIDVVIHPESIIHSLVEFQDKSVLAQMGYPDMRLPIQYALTYPERLPMSLPSLDLAGVGALRFEKPDTSRFPALKWGFEVLKRGGSCGAVFNAANETAVALFLERKISFMKIPELIERVMRSHRKIRTPSLCDVIAADNWARMETLKYV